MLFSLYHNRKVQRVQRGRIAIGAASRQGSEGSARFQRAGSKGCGIALRAMSIYAAFDGSAAFGSEKRKTSLHRSGDS